MTAPQNEVGGRSPFLSKGDNSPPSKAVFLCLSFFNLVEFDLIKLNIMMELFGQPLWLVSPLRDTANPLNSVANHFAVLRDGFTTLSKGITA
jgi:hypothetical protein